jgi:acyl carrier protein
LAEDPHSTVVRTVRALLRRREQGDVLISELSDGDLDNADLYDDLQFDSLEVAELSAILEDDLGRDPYTEGLVPRTVAEVVAFYTG